MGEMINAYTILVQTHECRRPYDRINVKWVLEEIMCEAVDWTNLPEDSDR
jgi:hypothetical protein